MIEFTTLGDSDVNEQIFEANILQNGGASFCVDQDGYSPARRLYQKVYSKIANNWEVALTQFSSSCANILAISMSSLLADLRCSGPSIGWAMDELLASQPNGSDSPVSLKKFLCRQNVDSFRLEKLLGAPRQLSGILLFNDTRLGLARINYNASLEHRISHAEMADLEEIFKIPPIYCA